MMTATPAPVHGHRSYVAGCRSCEVNGSFCRLLARYALTPAGYEQVVRLYLARDLEALAAMEADGTRWPDRRYPPRWDSEAGEQVAAAMGDGDAEGLADQVRSLEPYNTE